MRLLLALALVASVTCDVGPSFAGGGNTAVTQTGASLTCSSDHFLNDEYNIDQNGLPLSAA